MPPATSNPPEAEYFATLAKLRGDCKALTIAVTNLGGSIMDQIDLVQFWDSLNTAVTESHHRQLTQAFTATFVLSRECGREKDILQGFIRRMAERQGWLKG